MKTTLNISDPTMRKLKRKAARIGRTMSDLVKSALRMLLRAPAPRHKLPLLPAYSTGGARVDVANRQHLYDALNR